MPSNQIPGIWTCPFIVPSQHLRWESSHPSPRHPGAAMYVPPYPNRGLLRPPRKGEWGLVPLSVIQVPSLQGHPRIESPPLPSLPPYLPPYTHTHHSRNLPITEIFWPVIHEETTAVMLESAAFSPDTHYAVTGESHTMWSTQHAPTNPMLCWNAARPIGLEWSHDT